MSPVSPQLRAATPADAPDLLALVAALAEFEQLDPPDGDAQQRLVADAFGARPRFEPWLAFVEGEAQPVGYAIFLETYSTFLARPSLYIEDIFVRPGYRKMGIGGALLRKALELAAARECGRVEWTALDWNLNAQRVYEEKLGARRMSEWLHYRMTRQEVDSYLASTPSAPASPWRQS